MPGTTSAVDLKQADGSFSPNDAGNERLGGARADFVANLGRRGAEITGMLRVLAEQPRSTRVRDDLRRRIHALSAGARLLRFEQLADELHDVETDLEAASLKGELDQDLLTCIGGVVGRMSSLAWGQARTVPTPTPLPVEDVQEATTRVAKLRAEDNQTPLPTDSLGAPLTILIVGKASMAEALSPALAHDPGETVLEVERTQDMTVGIDLARALAPDVVLVDTELTGAFQLVEALATDPLTEGVPVVVTGNFPRAEDAGPYLALGVAKALPKPVSPRALRRACLEVAATYVRGDMIKEPLGDMSLDQLGARLAEELRRGLCDAAGDETRGTVVSLGEGTEVMATLWGAVARIRDLVTIRSGGQVRFVSTGPETAVPTASWLSGEASEGRTISTAETRGGKEVRLEGVQIVVADDDPAVNWFLSGVLNSAGAKVIEARDGQQALEIAHRIHPDLVVSDILMPKLDGFALCQAIKRDVVLRDVPVILLSWKDDLLQRVRELGATADGYLRKEATAGAIVQRVHEVLRRRRRVAERIAGEGEVRGRLDGLTTRTLLALACASRPASTVTVRDASFLYEVEIREGRMARATRTAADGTFQSGAMVLTSLLGVGDGRFIVSPPAESATDVPLRADLVGSLSDQLMPAIAAARAAQMLLSGQALVRVDRVVIDEERLGAYLRATPEPARGLLKELGAGGSPRSMITCAQRPAALLEDVLRDAAAHGAIRAIYDVGANELLTAEVAVQMARLRGEQPSQINQTTLDEYDGAIPEGSLLAEALSVDPFAEDETPEPSGPRISSKLELVVDDEDAEEDDAVSDPSASGDGPEPQDLSTAAGSGAEVNDAGAIEQWVADPGPASSAEKRKTPTMGSVVSGADPKLAWDTDAKTPPPPLRTAAKKTKTPTVDIPVHFETSDDPLADIPSPTPSPAQPVVPPGLRPMLTLGSLTPPPVEAAPLLERYTRKNLTPKPKEVRERTPTPTPVRARDKTPRPADLTPRYPRPSAYQPAPKPVRKDRRIVMWTGFAVAGIVFALWARWNRQQSIPEPLPPAPVAMEAAAEAAPAATETAAPQAEVSPTADPVVEDLPLRTTDKVKKDQGMLEVVCGKSDTVYVDNQLLGSGPVINKPLRAREEPYEIRVKLRGEERVRFVVVKKERLARVRIAPPWSQ